MYKKILWTVALALSLVLSPTVFADSWGCGEGLKKMLDSIKLDDAEKTKIKPILDQLKSSIKGSSQQFKDLDKQIKQQTESTSMDQSTVNNLVDQKTKLIGDMIKAKITAKNQILAILTPEQKTKLVDMMNKLEEKITAKFKSCHDQD